jgi:hypothetical protein
MNILLNAFSEPWIQRLGWVLIHFLWEGTISALVLAIFLRLLTKASSHTRYALAGIVLLICAGDAGSARRGIISHVTAC